MARDSTTFFMKAHEYDDNLSRTFDSEYQPIATATDKYYNLRDARLNLEAELEDTSIREQTAWQELQREQHNYDLVRAKRAVADAENDRKAKRRRLTVAESKAKAASQAWSEALDHEEERRKEFQKANKVLTDAVGLVNKLESENIVAQF